MPTRPTSGERNGEAIASPPTKPPVYRAYVCLVCGCSATAGDRRLLSSIGWKILPTERDAGDLPALCAPCAKKTSARP